MQQSNRIPYDVIVAGGGPAGASAAYFLGQAGLRVLVLEKENFPRYKACGGATSARLLAEFPFSFDSVIEARIQAVTVAQRGATLTFPLPDRPIHMVMRSEFDQYLLAHARAEVRTGSPVQSVAEQPDRVLVTTRAGDTFTGRYLVGADGPSSVVARSLGLRRSKTLLGAIEVEAPVSPEVFQRFRDTSWFIFGEIPMGYLWIFAKAEHLSVGIGALHPRPGELQRVLPAVMARYGISLQGLPQHGHPIPVYSGREPIATPRALLVGDAAGLVDPLSGEGIRYAVRSGRIAAETILAARPQDYQRRIQREIGANFRYALLFSRLLFRYPNLSFKLGSLDPLAAPAFVDLFSDRSDYAHLLLRLCATLPLFAARQEVAAVRRLFRSHAP